MPGFNKSAPVQLNVDSVVATSRRLAAGADAKKPLLVGADGAMHVSTPTRKLPDGWTKFKAALVNVPLIGRLPTIREAAQLMRASEFRDNFQAELADKFGNDIAVAVMAREGKPPKATLNSRKVVKVVDRANERATAIGRENTAALRQHDDAVARYACILANAAHPEFFRKHLDADACDGLRADARAELLRRVGSDTELPAPFDSVLRSYEYRLAHSSAIEQPKIATECLAALDDLATVLAAYPRPRGSAERMPPSQDAHVVLLLCANARDPHIPRYSRELATLAWHSLAKVQEQLRAELPGVPDELLADVMRQVTAGQATTTPDALHQAARKELFLREMKRQFDPTERESTLWNAVIEATAKHAGDYNITALMTSISKEMMLDLDFRWPALAGHFDCADHLPTLIAKTREQLIKNAQAAAVEHIEALEFIERTDTLTPAQKLELKRYADGDGDFEKRTPQRLSIVQVEQLTSIANTIARRVPQIRQAEAMGEPAVLFDAMAEIADDYRQGMGEILRHAESMWISRSFDGTDTEQRIFDLCIRLGVARLEDSPRRFPPNLSLSALAQDDAHERFYDSTVQQFLSACNLSSSMHVSKFAMFYGDVMRVTGHQSPDEPARPTPLSLIRPELLVRAFTHPTGSADEGGSLDQRGVLAGSPNGTLVARDFNRDNVLDHARHQFALPPPGSPPASIDEQFARIVDRAHIFVEGRRLIGDPNRWQGSIIDMYSQTFAGVPGDVGAAIAACMASNALPNFVADVNAAAFASPVTMANLRGAHEIWQGADGGWYVRSTHVGTPMGQDGKTIRTDGVVVYTLTHRIEPAVADVALNISLHDSNVVFAF